MKNRASIRERVLFLGLALLMTRVMAVCSLAKEIKPEVMKQYQKIYVRQRTKELNKLLNQMSQSSGTHLADRNFTNHTVPSPSGKRFLLCLSRERPETMDRWLFIIVETKDLRIGMVFDFIKAFDMERIKWLNDHRILVLTRSQNLSGPPGKLFHLNLNNGRADLLDEFVWRFAIEKTGDDIIYERSDDPREQYGKRNLFHLRISTRDRKRISQVRHPMEQFGEIGPFTAEGSFFKYEVEHYGSDSFEPQLKPFCYDLMTGKSFEDPHKGEPNGPSDGAQNGKDGKAGKAGKLAPDESEDGGKAGKAGKLAPDESEDGGK